MNVRIQKLAIVLSISSVIAIPAGIAWAGAHTWDVNEVFSDATGTIQFVELREAGGGAGEVNVNGRPVTSTNPMRTYIIPAPALTPPTSFKTLLLATPAFVGLPGAPTPDYVFPAGSVPFINIIGAANTVSYSPYDSWSYGAGLLPLDGVHSLVRSLATPCNTPTNYAGQAGTINLGCSVLGDCDNRSILGNTAVDDRALFNEGARRYDILLVAIDASARCDGCAMAIVTDTPCHLCNVTYRDGKSRPGIHY